MDRRYQRRTISPPAGPRRITTSAQPSGQVYAGLDPYYATNRLARELQPSPRSPRSTGDRFLHPDRPSAYTENIQPALKPRADHSRPRRATLDTNENGRRRPLILTTEPGLRPVLHASPVDRASSLAPPRTYRPELDPGIYLTPAATSSRDGHRRSFSSDNSGPSRYIQQIEGPQEYGHRSSVGPGSYRQSELGGSRRGYHLSGPLVRHPDIDNGQYGYDAFGSYGYGNTNPEEDFYREPALRQRQRENSIESSPRRERPSSMISLENHHPRTSGGRGNLPPLLVPRGGYGGTPMMKAASADRRMDAPLSEDGARRYVPQNLESESHYDPRQARHIPILHHDRDSQRAALQDNHDDRRESEWERERERDRGQRDRDHFDHHGRPRRHNPKNSRSLEGSPYHSPDLSEESEGDPHRRRHRHRHRDEALAVGVAMGAGSGLTHAFGERDAPGNTSSARNGTEKDNRDRYRDRDRDRDRDRNREHRERKTRETDSSEKISRGDREKRDRDATDRKRENRDREGRDTGVEDRELRDRRTRDRDMGGPGEDSLIIDLRDRQPRERQPREREKGSEDLDRQKTKQIRVVSPPREKEKEPREVKSILRQPREKFPEDPEPIREGVAPLKEALKDGKKGIPPGARWTKVDRKLVNPAALDEAQERYEERIDHVIVLRVLARGEIEKLAARTQEIRGSYTYRNPQDFITAIVADSAPSATDARQDRSNLDRERRESGRVEAVPPPPPGRGKGHPQPPPPEMRSQFVISPTEDIPIREAHPASDRIRQLDAPVAMPSHDSRSTRSGSEDISSSLATSSITHGDTPGHPHYPPPPSVSDASSATSANEDSAAKSSSRKVDYDAT